MGRKKLNLTEGERQERALRKKEQMKKVYEKQKLLKKRLVANLSPEQLEKKRKHDIRYREKARARRQKLMLGVDDNEDGFSDISERDVFIKEKTNKTKAESMYQPHFFIEEKEDKIKAESVDKKRKLEGKVDKLEGDKKDKIEAEIPTIIIKQENDSQFYYGMNTSSILIKEEKTDEIEAKRINSPDDFMKGEGSEKSESKDEEPHRCPYRDLKVVSVCRLKRNLMAILTGERRPCSHCK